MPSLYSAEKLQQVAAIEESTPREVDEPEADESGSTNRTNSVLMAEVGAIVEQEGALSEPAVGSRQTTGVSASGQTSSALSPNAVENAASSQTANSNLTSAPSISITGITADGPQGVVTGYVSDRIGVAELQIDGRIVPVDSAGGFAAKTFVPIGGTVATLTAFNTAGLSTAMSVMLERADNRQTAFSFEQLNPLTRKAVKNDDAIAVIVGVASYANASRPRFMPMPTHRSSMITRWRNWACRRIASRP